MGHRIRIGSIAGIEVRLHRSWALIALLIAWSFWNRFVLVDYGATTAVVMAVLGALLFFLSLLFHEFAHALEAQYRGVEVNGITLFLFGGVTEMSGEVRRPRDEFALTAIGPFASIVLAALFGLVAVYTGRAGFASVAQVAGLLGWINLALGVFNLLPGAPLDGGRILRSLVWAITGDRRRALTIAARAGQLIGALIAGLGLLQLVFVPGAFLGGIWLIVIGGFLAFAAQSEIAQQSIDEALGGLTVGELLRRDELVSVPADTDLTAAVEQLRVAPERTLAITREGRTVGVLSLDDVAQLEAGQRASREVAEVMLPVEELPGVDHRSEVTEALSEMAGGRPLAVTSHEDGQERIEGVVAPEQLQRIVRRTLELGKRQGSGATSAGTADGQHLPERGS
ncbi:MAG: site-2 protease family protein [Nitriliruptoraceae bacterium]